MKLLALRSNTRAKAEFGRETIQMRFAKARKFISPVNYIIQMGYATKNLKRKTPLGRAMRRILTEAMIGDFPDISVDPSLVKLSVGMLSRPIVLTTERNNAQIVLRWNNPTFLPIDHNDDRILLCAYAIEQELAAINDVEVLREAQQLVLQLPEGMEILPVHLYLIVHDRNKKHFSNSQYLGLFEI